MQANNIESYLADITEIKFQISKSMIVTGGLAVIVCKMILLYEARVGTLCWAIIDLWSGLQYWIYGRARGAHSRAPAH